MHSEPLQLWLWLWHRPAAASVIPPQPQNFHMPICCKVQPLKKKKKKKKKEEKKKEGMKERRKK